MSNLEAECPTEEELLGGLLNGDLSQWSEHIASCSKCEAFVTVVHAIHDDAELARRNAVVPSGRWMVLHTEIRKRREAAQRATLPLRWMTVGGYTVALAVVIAGLCGAIPTLFLGGPSVTIGNEVVSEPLGSLIAVAAVPITLLVTTVLRILWVED
jgi:predicted anti-sigma-YlaC factor YlaD